jgi:hypothetical protein
LQVVTDKVQLEARKSFAAYDQALQGYQLASEMVRACQDAEQAAGGNPTTAANAKAATAKAQLDFMKAEINYRITYAQLMGTIAQQ